MAMAEQKYVPIPVYLEKAEAGFKATAGLTLEELKAVTPAMVKAAPLMYEAAKEAL